MKRLWLGLAVMFVAVVAIVYFVMDRPWASSTLAVDTRVSSVHAPTVEITYIANEGILISAAGKQVLIDGLHREYGPEYAYLPAADRDIKPKQIIAVHISPAESQRVSGQIQRTFPGIIAFTTMLEKKQF